MSPGPIFDPQLGTVDIGGFARGLRLAGFSERDLVLNTFSYHLTPAGHTFESGARALGASVVPAGFGNTEQQLELVRTLAVNAYIGTPSFLRILATDGGWSFERACVAGEKLTETERADLEARGGRVHQVYGTADLGYIAGECSVRDGMHVTEDALVEVLDPASGEPVAEGSLGEVTVTTFSEDYPMLRFATGDLSRMLTREPCACGRTSARLGGVLGRVGPGVKVRGMFVYEHDVRAAASAVGITRFQVAVGRQDGRDLLELRIAAEEEVDVARAVEAFRDAIKLTVSAVVVEHVDPEAPALVDDRDIWEA